MILDKAWVELNEINGVELLKNLELAAKQCYRSQGNITEDSYKNFLRNCINRGHESVIEHEKVTVRIKTDVGCYDDATFVLTDKGFKLFKDVDLSDLIYTLDDDGNTVLVPINHKIEGHYDGMMHKYKNSQIDLLVTPNHNMWVGKVDGTVNNKKYRFYKSEDISWNCLKFNKIGNVEYTQDNSEFIIPGVDKPNGFYIKHLPDIKLNKVLFFELLGWWITDGCLSTSSKGGSLNSLCISQTKKSGVARLKYLLDNLKLKYTYSRNTFRIYCWQLCEFLRDKFGSLFNLNCKSLECKIPNFIKSSSSNCLEAFMRGVIGGNGTHFTDTMRQGIIYSASPEFCRDIVEICFKLNIPCNYYPHPSLAKYPSSWKQNHVTYDISLIKTSETWFYRNYRNARGTNFSYEYYNGSIYCLELAKYHRLFVMRNGFSCWCGNSYKDLTRHRHASFSVESTRYCNYSKDKFGNEIHYIEPVWYTDSWKIAQGYDEPMTEEEQKSYEWYKCMEEVEQHYLKMSELGCTPDQLRMILPHSTAGELVMTADLREWRHILSLRADSHAHPSCRQVMIPILLYFKDTMPELFDQIEYDYDFDPNKYAELRIKDDSEIGYHIYKFNK